jgi:sugar/nucleoside kinase (ribokinase family)
VLTVIGTTTFDLFLTGMDHIPAVGQDEFTTDSLAFLDDPAEPVIGGNGANSAFVAATLGTPTALCSFIGTDTMGAVVRGWLETRGVNLEGLIESDEWATACTAVAIDRTSQRLSLHHSGGSADYAPAMVPQSVLDRSSGLLFSSYHLMPQFRHAATAQILSQVRANGGVTALDFGPVIAPIATPEELGAVLPLVDFVIANEYELCSSASVAEFEEAAQAFLGAGCGAVVVKRGPSGATLVTGEGSVSVPAFAIEARGTVGAGDSFNAGFLHATLRGRSTRDALTFANAVAALVVGSDRGAMGAPSPPEVEVLLAER